MAADRFKREGSTKMHKVLLLNGNNGYGILRPHKAQLREKITTTFLTSTICMQQKISHRPLRISRNAIKEDQALNQVESSSSDESSESESSNEEEEFFSGQDQRDRLNEEIKRLKKFEIEHLFTEVS